ncbi:hypothetical protein FGU71_07545 [Erythrobacter insulae]|uniref:Uncharacterized protein n=1 Tax=Erythrobacter insulae TaxID=2584124 RepID=A0A547PC65_9SPHN|nr:Pr6Pr family membrane protein [Erythrobacter insulae]TRD11733.1 hypothetical protein FGU71_07545 [Erythrobacter insulae]
MDAITNNARFWAGIIFAIAAAALIVQPMLGDGTYLENLGGMVRFFTIWGNIAACFVMGWIAFGGNLSRAWMAALATALTVIALVYWGLLSGQHHPVGFDRITNQAHHTIVPAATIAWWLRFTPRAAAIRPMIPAIMIPPLSYGAFAFGLGELTGFYAYFFLDLPMLGWGSFLLNNALLALFFGCLGAGLVAVKNAVSRDREPVALT